MTQAITKHTGDPGTWGLLREQATAALRSGFLPRSINTPEKAIAVALAGAELGLPTMQALRSVHIIDGKPTLSADLMMALVFQRIPGAVCRVAQTTDERCIVEAGRPGQEATTFTFTMADAKAAGLTGKDNWRKYPRAMLRSRAVSEAVRATFPDALMGAYTPDELGAVTSESDGEVIDMPRQASPVRPAPRLPPELQHLSEPRNDPPPQAAAPKPAPSGDLPDPIIQFGKNKGTPVSALSDRQLQWYRDHFAGKLQKDPTSRYADEWVEMLGAVEARMGVQPTPAEPAPDTMGDAYEGPDLDEALDGEFD